jgi:alpha-glucosidase
VEARNGIKIAITETDLEDYPGMWLTGSGKDYLQATFPAIPKKLQMKKDRHEIAVERHPYIAKTKGARTFPWRILAISRSDGELVTNQLSYLLALPTELKDTSWIRPGKVAWDWWNANNLYGVDFKAGVNTETYKYYIDFAAQYGIEYIILDEGWYPLGDLLSLSPGIDMEAIMGHAREKNVGVILWVIWKTLDNQLEEALDLFEKWGVQGIKVDFMQRDDQIMVNYYHKIAREAAKRKLMVDFHGSYKPSGLRRAYPNVITREGVRGLEQNKWSDKLTPAHNVTIPFIRMLAGPMDYTPGAMRNAQKENFRSIFNRPMSMGTRCHQLAMYVIYESPLQMLADSPSNYLKEPECTSFIAKIPTTWDDTVVLHAKVGQYIALARRNGDHWFVGAMTNGEARQLSIDLSFLGTGAFTAEIMSDGINAHRAAVDYKRQQLELTPSHTLTAALAPGGGWATIIRPEK